MTSHQERIETLHGIYTRQTGQTVRLDMQRIFTWEAWLAKGFSNADLFDLIRHLRDEIRKGNRSPAALKFTNLVGNADFFEEDLALLRASTRPRPPATRTVRTGQTERIVPADAGENSARPVSEVIAAMRAAVNDQVAVRPLGAPIQTQDGRPGGPALPT